MAGKIWKPAHRMRYCVDPAEAVIAWLLCRLDSQKLEAGQALSQTG